MLVAGATALIQQARGAGSLWPWLIALLKRKPPKLVAVALANKIARIAWKLMVSGEQYRPLDATYPAPVQPYDHSAVQRLAHTPR